MANTGTRAALATPAVILVADDDTDDRILAKEALDECSASCDVRFVKDGVELLDYLFRRGVHQGSPRPRIILLDLNMPKMNGFEALEIIKSQDSLKRIPVVVFTTSSDEDDIGYSYDLGANSFIRKPQSFKEMLKLMESLSHFWSHIAMMPEDVSNVSN